MGLLVLLCCEDALYLYSLKFVIQGDNVSIQKVNLVKPCRWTTTFKKDEKESGLVLLYQSGDIEIRCNAHFMFFYHLVCCNIMWPVFYIQMAHIAF